MILLLHIRIRPYLRGNAHDVTTNRTCSLHKRFLYYSEGGDFILSEQQATPLIGSYVLQDFYTDKPYKELYDSKDNKFLQQIMIQRMRDLAVSLGFKGFMAAWKSYLAAQRNDVAVDDAGQDTMFENQPVQLRCGSYTCLDRVTRFNEYGMEVEVISHPLLPVKRVTNIETLDAKLEIAFCRGKKDSWKYITVPREMLASAQKIVGLAKQDIAVNSENAKEVVRYMGLLESKNYDDLPMQKAVSHMGWITDGKFMPYVDDISYDGESPELQRMFEEFKPTGSEQAWMDLAKEVRSGESVPARIALASSFAAPLVQILGCLPFFTHFWGETGCGKTVGLMLAASVWGNPEVGRYIKTFSGTKVSMELYAAFCCNLPILFDELQVVSDRKTFDDIIYMLTEGASKGRGAKEGGLQVQKRWASSIITTGEMPITQSNSGGGAVSRTIEVNYGGIPLFKNARDVANALKENYGHVGPKYIRCLQQDGVINSLKALYKKVYTEMIKEDVHEKQVISATLLLVADALATKAIFKDGNALTFEDLKPYLASRSETDVNLRCYQWLVGFCAANPRRFDSEDTANGEIWGKYKDGYVFINKTIFDDQLKNKGFSPGAFLDWARRKELLKCQYYGKGNKNNRSTWPILINGKAIPHVGIRLPAEEEKTEQEEYQKYAVVEDDDMPF